MQKRHRPWLDAAPETVAHDQVGSFTQWLEKAVRMAEVVAVIGVAHQHVFALCRLDAGHQRSSVAANWNVDHSCALAGCDLL